MSDCKIEDIYIMGSRTTFWSVDENGSPESEVDSTQDDFLSDYTCGNCGEDFNGFENAKSHIKGEK